MPDRSPPAQPVVAPRALRPVGVACGASREPAAEGSGMLSFSFLGEDGLHGSRLIQTRAYLLQSGQRLVDRDGGGMVLPQKVEDLWPHANTRVEPRVRAGDVGAQLDQIFSIVIGRERLTQSRCARLLL